MHSKSVDSLSLTRAGFIEYFLVATKLVHALTAIAPALFLLYYPGLVPVELRSNMLGLLLFFGALTVIMFQALDVYSDDIFSNRLRFRIMFFAWASAFCLLLFMYQGLGLFPYLSSKLVIFWFTGSLLLFGVQRLLVLRLYRAWMKRGMYLQRTVILGFTAVSLVLPAATASIANAGPHGLTEMLYAYSSAAGNNGSAFGGLAADTPWMDLTLGIAMMLGRFAYVVPVMAIAGSLAAKPRAAEGGGTFPTHGPLFAGLLAGVILILGGLQFLPSLTLGPIAEHFTLLAGKTF